MGPVQSELVWRLSAMSERSSQRQPKLIGRCTDLGSHGGVGKEGSRVYIDRIVVRRQTQPTRCPKCMLVVAPNDVECTTCGWDFNAPEGTQLQAASGESSSGHDIGEALFLLVFRLVVGGACWFAFMLLAMFAGFTGGYSSGQSWISFALVLGVGVLWWGVSPIAKLLTRQG